MASTESTELVAKLTKEFDAIAAHARELAAGLTERQFNWRTEPGRWSIGECLAHLEVIDREYLGHLMWAIEKARSEGRTVSRLYRPSFLSRILKRSIEPPVKQKLPAPANMIPPPDLLREAVMTSFAEVNAAVKDALPTMTTVDFGRIKVSSLINRFVRLSVGEWFEFMAAHDRRHLWQAANVRNHPDFPKS